MGLDRRRWKCSLQHTLQHWAIYNENNNEDAPKSAQHHQPNGTHASIRQMTLMYSVFLHTFQHLEAIKNILLTFNSSI